MEDVKNGQTGCRYGLMLWSASTLSIIFMSLSEAMPRMKLINIVSSTSMSDVPLGKLLMVDFTDRICSENKMAATSALKPPRNTPSFCPDSMRLISSRKKSRSRSCHSCCISG